MITITKSYRTEYGVTKQGTNYMFTVSLCFEKTAMVSIYDNRGDLLFSHSISEFRLAGSVYSFCISGIDDYKEIQYEYIVDGKVVTDPYMKNHSLKREFGEKAPKTAIDRAVYNSDEYDFEGDEQLDLDYSEIIAYQLHVRGFTKHPSSKVKGKGCYLGIIEKIPYLKELNINQVVLMPTYDFYEFEPLDEKTIDSNHKFDVLSGTYEETDSAKEEKVNYWGYKKANYFCPKLEYSYSKDAVTEFKDMVKALHKAGIEVIMQMFYPATTKSQIITDSLRFWYLEYHVDGFHVMGERIPKDMLFSDAYLTKAKLYVNDIGKEYAYLTDADLTNIADVNNGFMISARRFLKSDGDSINGFVNYNRHNPKGPKSINYITCYEGFTLNDLVSYEHKHNEENKENNIDGSDYNFSWNCGVEGKSSKKTVKELRLRQIKNALSILLLAQGTPMMFMGDEIMNTQNGNNNPYCQDNDISWLNWKLNKSSEEILNFTKLLTSFRKNHPVIHQKDELKNMDYLRCGFPDVSYHQDMAWKSSLNNYLLHIGIMLEGAYAEIDNKTTDDTLYVAYNMHWENHIFGLPRLKKGMKWVPVFATCDNDEYNEAVADLSRSQDELCVYKRSIMVLKADKSALKEEI